MKKFFIPKWDSPNAEKWVKMDPMGNSKRPWVILNMDIRSLLVELYCYTNTARKEKYLWNKTGTFLALKISNLQNNLALTGYAQLDKECR